MANTYSLELESSSSQYASITDAAQTGLDITGDLSLECWVKLESISVTPIGLISKMGSPGNYSFRVDMNKSNIYTLISDNGSSFGTVNMPYAASTGVWFHIAYTYKASTGAVNLYINGSSEGSGTNSKTSIFNGNGDFVVGASSNRYFDGLIDEVRVWNTERTATEIQDNYDKELIGTESNLQGYWRFNNDYTDETSNGNDLTAVNSPTFSTDVPFVGGSTNNSTS